MNLEDIYAEWSEPITKGQILCDSTYIRYLEKNSDTENRMVIVRAGRKGNRSSFYRWGVAVWEDENILGIGNGDGCITVWMYLMPLECTLKNGYNV